MGNWSDTGPLEAVVQARFPGQAIQYEAGALDRELRHARPSWSALQLGIESFFSHYPALLLDSPQALQALGQGCLGGLERAPSGALRARFSRLLVGLLDAVAAEVERQGSDKVPAEVPGIMAGWLSGLRPPERGAWAEMDALVPDLVSAAKRVLMVADEGRPPAIWFDLLKAQTRLLLAVTRWRVSGEPAYDGCWDVEHPELVTGDLSLLRQERISADLRWLDELAEELESEQTCSAVDVFLKLASDQRREERETAWRGWFDEMARRSDAGELSASALELLCKALAGWIEQVEDRRFLAILASALRRSAPRVLDAVGRPGLGVALESLGRAVAARLAVEAGGGQEVEALEDLRQVACDLVERRMGCEEAEARREALELGLHLACGPVVGQPLDRRDLAWRIDMARRFPEAAEPYLASLVAAFGLEALRPERCLAEPLSALLDASWPEDAICLVRAVLRSAPWSPLSISGPTIRACMSSLAQQRLGARTYLHDLAERLQTRSGREDLVDVERVLRFWQMGDISALDGLASSDSLASLPALSGRHEQLGRILENLSRHAPGEASEQRGQGRVRWLARLPETYYGLDEIRKIAGFEGLEEEAVRWLVDLLCIYRILVRRHDPDRSPLGDLSAEELETRADLLLSQRRQTAVALFAGNQTAEARLDVFLQDMERAAEQESILDELARRETVGDAALFERLLALARLSGLRSTNAGAADSGSLAERARHVSTEIDAHELRLRASLAPRVIESARRLRHNPLSEPAPAARTFLSGSAALELEALAEGLADLLVDDMLSADGLARLRELATRLRG
ncbi:MAG: hypothetical protein JXR96_21490 [Deltaproteobacteria bacterium]|nr:hypothetical protein [Deltaproteobacteria bacterium]